MESSASAPPSSMSNSSYSDKDTVDRSGAAMPMLQVPSDPSIDSENPTCDTTGNATEDKDVLVAINDEELSENSTKIPVVETVQRAAGYETQNVTPQEANNEVLLGESTLLQEDKDEGLPVNEEKIPMERVNGGLVGQNDVGLPEEDDIDEGRYGENEKLL